MTSDPENNKRQQTTFRFLILAAAAVLMVLSNNMLTCELHRYDRVNTRVIEPPKQESHP